MTEAERDENKRRQADMLEEKYKKGSMYVDPRSGNQVAVKKKGRLSHMMNSAETNHGKVQ